MRGPAALLIALAACGPEPERPSDGPATWGVSTSPGIRGLPEALRLGVGTVAPGARFTLRTQGLAPGERAYAVASAAGVGDGACPAPLGGVCLGVASPYLLLGSALADAAGVATLDMVAPRSLSPGVGIGLQTVALRGPGGVDTVVSPAEARVVSDGVAVGLDALVAGDLVVTEVMANPGAVLDSNGEWFEVLNLSPHLVELDGLEVSDLGANRFVVEGPLRVGPGQRVVLGASTDPAVNGGAPVDYAWSGFSLGNADDEVVLVGVVELDRVVWDGGPVFPDLDGASMQVDAGAADAASNDDGGLWCSATLTYGAGDLGTPGLPNDLCDRGPLEPACDNGILDGDEVDVDCGGPDCAPCPGPPSERDEDFETGDFGAFPWQLDGDTPWVIETDPAACAGGSACMRTSPFHAADTYSSAELGLSLREDGQITFQANVQTELDEHYFRFYVDDALAIEVSGDLGWRSYEVDVEATPPGGEPTRFRWEYSRSGFVAPDHPPLTAVWVDDIDVPAWNSSAPVPAVLAPADGTWVADVPLFAFDTPDPDGDPVAHEVQWSATPDFAAPVSSGELLTPEVVPDLDDGLWFWRVRAKDDVDFRWSEWSATRTLEVGGAAPVWPAWRQAGAEALLEGAVDAVEAGGGGVTTVDYAYDVWTDWTYMVERGGDMVHAFRPDPARLAPGDSGLLTVEVQVGIDWDKWVDFHLEGETVLAGWREDGMCGIPGVVELEVADVPTALADGVVDLVVDPMPFVEFDDCPLDGRSRAHLVVDSLGPAGTLTSPPIHHSVLDGADGWGRVAWQALGDVRVQVLDADRVPLADELVPGNAAGLVGPSVQLWNVDPDDHPVLHLHAVVDTGAMLDSWSIVATDTWAWEFEQAGDAEGWVAEADGIAPIATVADGVYTLEHDGAGSDPRMVYVFPGPVDAARFTTLEVDVRTSNTWVDDVPELWWASSFGDFDPRRTQVHAPIYLLETRTVVFDLTAEPDAPAEPWRGALDGIRLDLVDGFEDALGEPTSGWWEVEAIRMY
ncbi:MAG: hypothetical protein ACI8PZ_005936 [Myxococcota bacterium]|jgi:hypothetical protein